MSDEQAVTLERLLMSPSKVCREFHIQVCHHCDDIDCCDNTSSAKTRIKELTDELAKRDKVLDDIEELLSPRIHERRLKQQRVNNEFISELVKELGENDEE